MSHLDECDLCQKAIQQLSELPMDHEVGDIFAPSRDSSDESRFETPSGSFQIVPQDKNSRIGSLRIVRKIGEGGMAQVFECVDERVGRHVAVKRIEASVINSRNLDRLRREARIHAQLKHPNIVQLLEFDISDGLPYLVMELVEGGTLRELFKTERIKPRLLAQILRDVALAVQAAHDLNILHRDLKPANILLERRPRSASSHSGSSLLRTSFVPKVTDFGLAKILELDSDLSASAMYLGTPSYMSPEQTYGESGNIGPTADVYALGVILYEGLAGHLPFVGEDLSELFSRIRERPPVPPSELRTGVPHDLEIICLKCLEKEPRARYASAGALADDLERFLVGKLIKARPVGPFGQLWRWSRQKPVRAASLFLLIAEAIAFGGGGIYFASREAEDKELAERSAVIIGRERDRLREDYRKLRGLYQFGIDLTFANAQELDEILKNNAPYKELRGFQQKLLDQRGEMAVRVISETQNQESPDDFLIEAYYLAGMKKEREQDFPKSFEYYRAAIDFARTQLAIGPIADISRYFAIRSLNQMAKHFLDRNDFASAEPLLCEAWETFCTHGQEYVLERAVKQNSIFTAFRLIDCLYRSGQIDEARQLEIDLDAILKTPVLEQQSEVDRLF